MLESDGFFQLITKTYQMKLKKKASEPFVRLLLTEKNLNFLMALLIFIQEVMKKFFQECTIVGLSNEVKESTIEIRAKYRLKLPDCIIAATTISTNLPLISADHDFSKIEELDFIGFEV